MNAKHLISLFTVFAVALAGAANAVTQEARTLDAEASGSAVNQRTGDTYSLDLTVDGDVVVTTSDHGVDRTAASREPLAASVTVDGVSYAIPVSAAGEGVSLVQTGVSADAWRLNAQGTSLPTADGVATFRGSLTLLGADEGYTLNGDGVLTVTSGGETTTYLLTYAGSATFE